MSTPGEIHYKPEERAPVIERVLDALRSGLTEYKSAEAGGISYPTWFRWREQIPGLKERIHEAKLARIPLLEDALYKLALKGSYSAIMAILEKEDADWRNRAIDLKPTNPTFIFEGGASALLAKMKPETRKKFLGSLQANGLLPESVIDIKAEPQNNG